MNIFVEKLQSPDFPILFTKKDLKKLAFEKDVLDDLFNEAIIKSFVVNVYKGIYTLERMYRRTLLENGVLAQKIIPYSYISLSFLSHLQWHVSRHNRRGINERLA